MAPPPTPDRRSRLRAALTALALLALVAVLFGLAPRSRTPPEPSARARPDEPSRPAPAGPGLPPRPGAGPARPPVTLPDGALAEPFEPHDQPIVPPPLPSARLPYPPGSQPLTEGTNPASQPPEDDPVDPKNGVHVIFGPRVAVVHPPDPLVIDLQVLNKLGAGLPITDGVARFRSEHSDIEKGPWFPSPLVDDGSGRDLASGDLHFTATYTPPPDQQAALFAGGGTHVYLDVRFTVPGIGFREYATTMEYSRQPDAALNGKYVESLDQGSLVVSAGVTAKVAGEYRVIASLYGRGQAIAFAQKTATLEAGDGSVPLLFFGKILHDRGIDGPYDLRYVMLFQRTADGEIPGENIDPAYTTQAYSARSFSDAAYVPPAPSFEVVDMNSPSQQGKPPPLFSEADRERLKGPTAPIKADNPNRPPQPVPTGTK